MFKPAEFEVIYGMRQLIPGLSSLGDLVFNLPLKSNYFAGRQIEFLVANAQGEFMKPLLTGILSLVFSLSAFAAAVEPSSEIPAKREFPVNDQINPCENFHQYVCSKVEASFKLRDDRSRHTFSFSDSSERILEAKKDFFKNIEKEKKLSPRAQQVKDYYLACMDEKSSAEIEQKELKKLQDELSKITTMKQFAEFQTSRIPKGEYTPVYFAAYSNQDNPKVNDIYISTYFMNLPEYSYYDNKELMAEYRKLAVEFFKIADPKLTDEQAQARADRAIKFEKSFVDVYPHPEVLRQRWSEKRQEKQEDFLKKYPLIAFESILAKTPKSILISNSVPETLEFYNKALADSSPEALETLKDFVLLTRGRSILDDSNPEYFKKGFDFSAKYLGGPVARADRQERCTRSAMNNFVLELDQVLIKKLFPHFPAAKFKTVAAKIRESIITGVKNNDWLEPATKAKAILKMEKAKLYLIQPETEKQWDFLPTKKYSTTDRFANARLRSVTSFERAVKTLKNANLEAWGMGPLTVNAYYDPSANKFVMPMGILQYPFFNAEGDLIENLGAVGAVIGHELGHGIDDQGAKYDENGKLVQWFTMKDFKEFSERGRKLIDQFNKAGHNGALTLGENIGDLVGLTFAYNAAFPDGKASVEDEKKLFIAYGRLWCGVNRPKAEEQLLKTDPHALGRARINEQVKHQKAFARAFSCKPGDKMTLPDEQRVKIW
jgi:putative endopeptidase